MPQLIDCYRILQVQPTADKTEITASYRRLSKMYHPDVNRTPGAEELMKNLNAAYHILRDELRRREYDIKYGFLFGQAAAPRAPHSSARAGAAADAARPEAQRRPEEAARVMSDYLGHLLAGENEKAYQLLCLHDRQYVTMQSFCKWRQSVQKLFAMRDFRISHGEDIDNFQIDEGLYAQARKLYINITEKNFTQNTTDKYQFIKYTVLEYGKWRVFLGYRDLNEIAMMFEDLSRRQEQGEMAKKWEEYCRYTCRGLDMLSREGLVKEAERELYRCKRYGQSMTVALFSVKPAGRKTTEEALGDIVECCAGVLAQSLRETDIPAYIGNGVFAVLFVEMKKRSAAAIVRRMAEKLADGTRKGTGRGISPQFIHCQYEGGELAACIDSLVGKLKN